MNRTISVKGEGRLSAAPDLVTLSLTVSVLDKDYAAASDKTAAQTDSLKSALLKAGLGAGALKTAAYRVNTEYESEYVDNRYINKFAGYRCTHSLTAEFALDMKLLNAVLTAVAGSGAEPEISVSFSVSEPESLQSELLARAAVDARTKAKALCAASGAELGEIVRINCGAVPPVMTSNTEYAMSRDCLKAVGAAPRAADIDPADIDLRAEAVFVWEIK
jgi:uncharacterized protein YggE